MKDDIWERKEYLLFDLDGTLTDPKIGITTCVQYALKEFGIDEPDLDKLEPFIGPPLKVSFMQFYDFTDEQAEKAVAKYRERFQEVGLFENEVYRGIPQMLAKLKFRGLHMAIASSKPTVYVERILEHFHIREYFEAVVGSELDGTRTEKAEVVQEALRQLFHGGRVEKNKIFMIGDRKYDVEGAKALGIESVGVAYGYGGMEELMGAHADYIVRSVEELRRFLLRGYEDMEKDLNPFQKIWVFVYHFAIFIAIRKLVELFGGAMLFPGTPPDQLSANARTIIAGLGFLAAGAAIFRGAKKSIRRTIRDMYLTHLTCEPRSAYGLLTLAMVGLSLGASMLLSLSGITGASDSFQNVQQNQMGAALWIAVLCYGFVSPFAEELLFRGIFYGYLRRFYDIRTAIVTSAFLFAVYHGNLVQGVYAAAMGYLIAYAYEYFGSFAVPAFMHIGMNLLALLVSYTGIGNTGFCSWPICIVLLFLGGAGVLLLARRKQVL